MEMQSTMQEDMCCEICLEVVTLDLTLSPLILIPAVVCRHAFCRSCWMTWLEQCEQQRFSLPHCPKCRISLPLEVVEGILQRPFEPSRNTINSESRVVDDDHDMDEFTKTALEEMGVRHCPYCSVPIVKETGCDAMQCLCGQRFCFKCGAAHSCDHVGWYDEWYNNITGYDEEPRPELANLAELRLNMRNYLERKRRNAASLFWEKFWEWRAELVYEQMSAPWLIAATRQVYALHAHQNNNLIVEQDYPENVERRKIQSLLENDPSLLECYVTQAFRREALVEQLTFVLVHSSAWPTQDIKSPSGDTAWESSSPS